MAGDGNSGDGPGIPSWQRSGASASSGESKPEAADTSGTSQAQQQQQDTKSLLQRAQHWLQDETVRDSSRVDKVAFLKSKGMSEADIESALTSTTSDSPSTSSTAKVAASEPSSTSSPSSPAITLATSSSPSSVFAQKRDVPPIITYPEFLVHSSKPPPLITARRLLNTAYVAAGASALVYGTSKYLVTPMTDSLNAARHDFAHHAQEQLTRLNTALEGIVSTDPAALNAVAHRRHLVAVGQDDNGDDDSDAGTEDSDPTELFHRDFGTQTADLPSTPDSSSSSTAASDADSTDGPSTTSAESQARKLRRLRDLCEELTTEEKSEADTQHEIGAALKILDEHLQSMSVPVGGYGGYGGGGGGGVGWEVPGSGPYRRRADDEIGKIKAEIRSVKGVLLSAKHFPSGGGAGRANAVS